MIPRLRWPGACAIGALAILIGLLAVDSGVRIRHLRAASEVGRAPDAGAPQPGPPSEPPFRSRQQILSLSGADGYQWIVHGESMLAEGGWRVRRTGFDNAPAGREVHWSSGPIWWLLLLGRMTSSVTGRELDPSIEQAALFACPVQLACLMILLAVLVWRRFGAAAACALSLTVATAPRLVDYFRAGYLDHHGLAAVAGLGTALFAAAAGAGRVCASPHVGPSGSAGSPSARPDLTCPGKRAARRWILASAAAGSIGLWISSASQVPVLVGVGLGALAASLRWRGKAPELSIAPYPVIWRLWGWAGAAGSLAFYLLEYFPSWMGMRLEVNHPLYAVAWAGAGELLYRGCRRLSGGRLIEGPSDRPAILLAALALAALPALIAIAPDRFFWVSNPALWSLHRDISEFHSLARKIGDLGLRAGLGGNSILPVFAVPAALALFRSRLEAYRKGMIAVVLLPALVVGTLATLQVRWLGNQEALWIALLVVWVSMLADWRRDRPRWGAPATVILLGLALLQALPPTVRSIARGLRPGIELDLGDRLQLVMRDVAHQLRARSGDRPPVVLSGPTATTPLIYFGGLRGLGTLYWENRDGLEASAAIYGSTSDDEALRRIRDHQVTHLVSFSWESYEEALALHYRDRHRNGGAGEPFARRLKSPASFPVWVRPVNYRIPPDLGLLGQEVLILEVRPEQTPAEHLAAMGDYFLVRGEPASALVSYQRALAAGGDGPETRVGLARAAAASGDVGESMRQVDHALAVVPQEGRAGLAVEVSRIGQQIVSRDPRSAVGFYRRALAIDPQCRAAMNNLAWLLATSRDEALRNGPEAVQLATAAVALDGGNDPLLLDTLAAAYAEAGRWEEAVETASRAVRLAAERGMREVEEYESRLARYRAGQPHRQAPRPSPDRPVR